MATLRTPEVPQRSVTGGEMAALIRSKDWSKTPIGAESTWSPTLRMMVNFLLANRFPLLLWWGPQYVSIYNDAYIPVLGKKHSWALGEPVSKCWEEIWPVLQPLIDTPFQGGAPTWSEDLELEIKRSDFIEETHFTVAYSPVPDETAPGGIGGVLATVHEITEKIVGERRVEVLRDLGIRATEGRTAEGACKVALETLGQHPKDIPFAVVYLFDRDGHTAQLAGAVGIGDAAVVAPPTLDLNPESDKNAWPATEALRHEQTIVVDLKERFSVLPHGFWSEPPKEAVVAPIRSNKAHEPAGLLIGGVSSRLALDGLYRAFFELVATQIATAIANARAYEEERKRAEALAEIDHAKTLFFSNVSHEFRTPLTLMLGPLEDLLRNPDTLRAEQRGQVEVAQRNSLRLLKLVNTLLDFSRIEAGRAKPQFEQTDLSTFTLELAGVFRSAMEKAGLNYVVHCPPLPQPVFVDRDMWEKVVFNLLSNAFKFTPSGEVRVSLHAENGMAVLSVRDTGSGIPSWELPNIFKRFHRVENAHGRTHEGTGIGLALAQELVKLHEGTTEVESKLGVGTIFCVRIPFGTKEMASQDKISKTPPVSTAVRGEIFVEEALAWLPKEPQALEGNQGTRRDEEIAPSRSARDIARARILLAEDNADMRNYLRHLLNPIYEVEAVTNGVAALVAARANTPDLILSDVMMSEMDGLELVKTLRREEGLSSTPIILLSARAGEEAKVEGMSRGADDYLVKPFSARELLARESTHIELACMRKKSMEMLRESEQRFRMLTSASFDVIYEMSPDWAEMRRLDGKNFLADSVEPSQGWLEKYIHPDDQAHVMSAIRTAIRDKSVFDLEHRVLRIDGSLGWTHSRAVPVFDGDGKIATWFGAATDITNRKYTEDFIRRTAQFDEAVMSSMGEGLYTVDANGMLTSMNPAAEKLLGWSLEELRGNRMHDMTHHHYPDGRPFPAEECPGLLVLKQGNPLLSYEDHFIRKDGTFFDVVFSAAPVIAGGEIVGIVVVFRDVSAHVKARLAIAESEQRYRALSDSLEMQVQKRTEQLERQKQEVVRQSEKLRELSSRMLKIQDDERRHIARELHDSAGQLVTALSMSLSIVAQHIVQDQVAARALQDSQELTQQLSKEIRTTSYLLHPPLLEENGLVGALRWYTEGLANRSGLDIHLSTPEEFERFSPELELVMFRFVQECLTNVHRHSGSQTAFIRIERKTDHVNLEVRDQGQGISSEKLARIQTQDSGVGIRGMQERVRHFRGELRVESDFCGTRVLLKIPVSTQLDVAPQDRNQRLQAAG